MNSLCRFTVSEPYGLEGTLKACLRALAAGPARCFWPPHLHAHLSKAAGLWSFSGPAEGQFHAFSGKLDDGWPESVEEQSLLLLVWRHHTTKQYMKDVL